MEIRTLQKTGGSSFSITLPKDWIKRLNLKDKDRVSIDLQKTGAIIIQPYYVRKPQSIIMFDIKYMSENMILREIIASYIRGADEIHLISEQFNSEQRSIIREATNMLLGVEIIEATSQKVIIKNIFDSKKFSIIDNIGKMFLITLSMYQDVQLAIEGRDRKLALDVIERDIEIDKLYIAIVRQFHSLLQNKITEEEIGLSLFDLHYYESIAIQLERIEDHIAKIARIVMLQSKKSQKVFDRTLKRKTKKVFLYLQQTEQLVRLLDKKLAHEIIEFHYSSDKNAHINKNISKKTSIDIIIEDSIDRIREYITNIAEETIDYLVVRD